MKNNQAEKGQNQFSYRQHEQAPAREVGEVYLKAIGRLTMREYFGEWRQDLARELTRIGRGIQGRHTQPNDLASQTHEQIERRVSGRVGPWLQEASNVELTQLSALIADQTQASRDRQLERGQGTPDAWDREHDPAEALGRLVFREQLARHEDNPSAQS